MTLTGTAQWGFQVRLGDLFTDEQMPFEQKRDTVVERLRAAGVAEDVRLDRFAKEDFERLVSDLALAPDAEEFDRVLDDLFDWGDDDKRMWIQTF